MHRALIKIYQKKTKTTTSKKYEKSYNLRKTVRRKPSEHLIRHEITVANFLFYFWRLFLQFYDVNNALVFTICTFYSYFCIFIQPDFHITEFKWASRSDWPKLYENKSHLRSQKFQKGARYGKSLSLKFDRIFVHLFCLPVPHFF